MESNLNQTNEFRLLHEMKITDKDKELDELRNEKIQLNE